MSEGIPLAQRFTRSLDAGQKLFDEGDPGESMFVIQSGTISVFRRVGDTEVPIAKLGAGELVGEMAVLEGLPRTACAVAIETSVVVELPSSLFEQIVRENGEIALRVLRKLSARLREADRLIHAFLASSGAERAIEMLRGLPGLAEGKKTRTLPAGFDSNYLATLAGIPLEQAKELERSLRQARVIDGASPAVSLAGDSLLEDYLRYLELGQRYDPLSTAELAGVVGLPEDEVHRIVQRVLEARLASGGGSEPLVDSYREYLGLKRRFEYPAARPSSA
jgi:CRP/FNR family transcriptional regulator, cyclic AMP receptor protein